MSVILAFKAEVVLGFLLVSRHRAPRAIAVLGIVLALAVGAAPRPAPESHVAWLSIAGVVAAVLCSRLLARGATLESVRQAVVDPKLAVTGRFLGGMLLVVPLVVGVGLVIGKGGGPGDFAEAVRYAVAIGAVTACVTAVAGASGAAIGGLTVVLVGAALASGRYPGVDPRIELLWNALPISMTSTWGDSVVPFVVWLVLCLWLGAAVTARAIRGGGVRPC